ncbi:uncharacterized protein LOC134933255 [Pseudophryne corroboree]|uniref:uncharacterized protein LOC134933255 n=1 Tax=Pseudophryne corroboree TaxID=495146 RepID=UPI0030821717
MESLRAVIASLEGGDLMVSLDIKDAYLHVPIYPPHQAYLRFAVQDCHYQFQTLPFGLSTAPRIFTKVMAEMMVLLRKQGVTIIPYLDDLLIKARSREQLLSSVSLSLRVLQQHGWILNIPKSQLVPTTRLTFLGMILDTDQKRVYLPTEKAQELMTLVRNLLKPKQVSVHHCTLVLGKMVASYEAILFGRFHARTFQWDLLDKWSGSHLQIHRLITLSPQGQGISPVVAAECSPSRGPQVRHSGLGSGDHGREPPRLGSSHTRKKLPGSLVKSRNLSSHQRPGAEGHIQRASSSGDLASRLTSSDPVRQHHRSGSCKPPGRHKEQSGNGGSHQDSSLGGKSCKRTVSSVHSGSGQLGSRLPQQT